MPVFLTQTTRRSLSLFTALTRVILIMLMFGQEVICSHICETSGPDPQGNALISVNMCCGFILKFTGLVTDLVPGPDHNLEISPE